MIGFHNLNYKINQYKLQEESSLFYVRKDDNGNFLEVSYLTYNEKNLEEYKVFVEKIHAYCFTYLNPENKSEADFNKKYMKFDENTLKNSVFSINSINDSYDTYSLLDEVTDVSTNKKIQKSAGEKILYCNR